MGDRHYGYILRGSVTGLYKVGISGDVERRFQRYKTHVPERITQEAVKAFISAEEAKDWERSILEENKDAVEHGEWLRLNFSEMARICCAGIIRDYGTLGGKMNLLIADTPAMFSPPITRVFRCEDIATLDALDSYFDSTYSFTPMKDIPRFVTMAVVDGLKRTDEIRMAQIENKEKLRDVVRVADGETGGAK